jgi:H+/Cl- antiporter ClcA
MAMAAETSNPAAMEQGQLTAQPFLQLQKESFQPAKESFQLEWCSKQTGLENKEGSFSEVTEVQHAEPVDLLASEDVPSPSSQANRRSCQLAEKVAYYCQQLGKRVWQMVLYVLFVVPPSIVSGFCDSLLLYGIKLVTAVRNGTCKNNSYEDLLDTASPLVACEDIVGAKRWLIFFLPFCGVLVAALYVTLGNKKAAGGMSTILTAIRDLEVEIERVREAGGELAEHNQREEFKGLVSLRMCPLVYIGTVTTHLFGGSAGREGSALQMAAAIFSKYCDALDATIGRAFPEFCLTPQMRRAALVAAIAVGFSGIFGVPVTGAVFAVEVVRVGEISIGEMLTPAVIGAFVADWTCRLVNEKIFGFEGHSRYDCQSCQSNGMPSNWFEPSVDAGLELLAVVPAAFAFGLCGHAFEFLLHLFKDFFGRVAEKGFGKGKAKDLMAPFIGGWVVVLMWLVLCLFGSTSNLNFSSTYAGNDIKTSTFGQAYLGLSVYEPGVSISSCFLRNASAPIWGGHGPLAGTQVQPIMWYSFLLKLIFTTVTLGASFKGGEVTPLFFIGAALGNICGFAMGQDTQLFSALGLVSVFGAAANTPIACTFMGIELFGGAKTLPFLLSCYIAYLVSNTKDVKGIYKQEPPRGDANEVAPIPRMSSGTLRGSSGTLRGFPRV